MDVLYGFVVSVGQVGQYNKAQITHEPFEQAVDYPS